MLDYVKRRLAITFSEADEDILDYIKEAENLLTAWTGKREFNLPATNVEDSVANTLIAEYARYARSGAADTFRKNYLDMIINLQLEVARNAAPTE